jgi:hypothetical protein
MRPLLRSHGAGRPTSHPLGQIRRGQQGACPMLLLTPDRSGEPDRKRAARLEKDRMNG